MAQSVVLWDLADPPDASLSLQLAQCGLVAEVATDIDRGLSWLHSRQPALLLIRAGDASAVDLCRSVHMLSNVPIMVLCTTREEDLVVQYLRAGAERVLIGSPTRRDLAARIGAMLAGRNGSNVVPVRSSTCYVGELVIDPKARVVTKQGRFLSLTPTEFRLLVALARRAGMVVTHGELLSEVWGADWTESPEILRHYIRYLRQKLGDSPAQPSLILNQRGVGYRLAQSAA